MTATVPTEIAAWFLGVGSRTINRWTNAGFLTAATPPAGSQPARYEIAELRRWRRECTEGHGPECRLSTEPFHPGVECACVACNCGDDYRPGWMGSCARCHRPLVVDGRVVR